MATTGTTPTKPICRYCKSDDVVVEAFASWNNDLDDWELSSTYDAGFCNTCQTEMKWFDWVPSES